MQVNLEICRILLNWLSRKSQMPRLISSHPHSSLVKNNEMRIKRLNLQFACEDQKFLYRKAHTMKKNNTGMGMHYNTGADTGFPVAMGANPEGGRQHTHLPDFPKNCMKLRKFWFVRGEGAPPPWIRHCNILG